MAKNFHEVRDPVHVFVRFDTTEREVINSRPLQRLRHIQQLGMSHLVYPGATHKRFEHSLGVMELAGRVFDVITDPRNVAAEVRDVLPEEEDDVRRWRRVLRMAALCHDIGHLPFSHVAEKELLPQGWTHERLTMELLRSDEMISLWKAVGPLLDTEEIVKLAVGPVHQKGAPFTDWEAILSEIITGDAFGVDRMDYLLRDSHHAGVVYGQFGHIRLIDTLRVLRRPGGGTGEPMEPMLGIEEGGLHSVEALLLARYFMYSQVYCHPVRRVYDIHLKEFLEDWLPSGKFSTDLEAHLKMTDNEVTVALLEAARDPCKAGHDAARRIVEREHFKLLWSRNPVDRKYHHEPGAVLFGAAKRQFGSDGVRRDFYTQKGASPDFPVKCRDGRVVSSLELSDTLSKIAPVAVDYIFIAPEKRSQAEKWRDENREKILKRAKKKKGEA